MKTINLNLYHSVSRIAHCLQSRQLFHLQTRKAEFLDDFTHNEIHAPALERISIEAIGEMDGIKKVTFIIEKSPEVHHIVADSCDILDGYEIAHHADFFTDVMNQFFCFYLAPESCFQ